MRREFIKTSAFVLVAVAVVAAAAWINPEASKPAIFSDQGEPLFPAFRDVLAVKAIEVVDYNESDATAKPLKVEFRKGRWVISSHNDYPAEAKDMLAKTAAGFVDLKKDIVVSDRVEDHARLGVIDPLDQKVATLQGRGKRVTLRNAENEVLIDLIEGKPVKERAGYRYIRLPGQKRTYAVKTDADPSARFEDWVEADLLRLSAGDIRRITINSYSIDENLGRLTNVDRVVLTREGDNWTVEGGGKANRGKVQSIIAALDNLRVVGARPKPEQLAQALKSRMPLQMTLETVMSLRQRGFFISPDGRLLSNAGEMSVETAAGLIYSLRFGEVVTGASDRYLLVTLNPRQGSPPSEAADRTAKSLESKFADWYYIISSSDFEKLRVKRQDLIG